MKDNSGLSEKKESIAATLMATKKITELPRDENWRFNPKHVQTVVAQILEICTQYGLIPTINYMSMALGVSKPTELNARTGVTACDEGVVTALQEYARICESVTMQAAMDGTVNNITGIFALKSVYGYRDEPKEIVVTHNINGLLGDRKNPQEIAERYAEAVVIDVEPKDLRRITEGDDGDDEEEN